MHRKTTETVFAACLMAWTATGAKADISTEPKPPAQTISMQGNVSFDALGQNVLFRNFAVSGETVGWDPNQTDVWVKFTASCPGGENGSRFVALDMSHSNGLPDLQGGGHVDFSIRGFVPQKGKPSVAFQQLWSGIKNPALGLFNVFLKGEGYLVAKYDGRAPKNGSLQLAGSGGFVSSHTNGIALKQAFGIEGDGSQDYRSAYFHVLVARNVKTPDAIALLN